MKVGIITFHFVSNQGGVLQAYASQTFLEKHGHEAFIIDYRPGYHTVRYAAIKNPFIYAGQYWKMYVNRSIAKRIQLTARSFARCIYLNVMRRDVHVKAAYDRFIDNNLHLTKEYRSLKQLAADPPKMDAYVSGSDQLWNPDISDYKYDEAYFLNFGENGIPKVTYAVSTGKNLSIQEESQLSDLCKDLTAVSLREFNSSTSAATGKDVHICVDPTLLLDACDYESVESKQPDNEPPYIFVYGFETTEGIKSAVEAASKKYGFRVINGSPDRIKLEGDIISLREYGPDRFLTLIKNAQCVVTNSFHGTAFSIIYKKDFITVAHTTRGRRMIELLGKLDLHYRLWETETFSFDTPVDWDSVYNKLNTLRKHSGEYLLSAVQGVLGEEIPHWDEEHVTFDSKDKYDNMLAYAGFLTDEKALREVASGGAATAIAEQIIKDCGTVVGAAYSSDFRSAEYIIAEAPEDLEKLKGSKYIPADKKSGGY